MASEDSCTHFIDRTEEKVEMSMPPNFSQNMDSAEQGDKKGNGRRKVLAKRFKLDI
jgi:hypothetical protein